MNSKNNLKLLRKAKKMNQQQIADILNITQATYSNYENGNTEAPYQILVEIAKFFNVTVDYILGGEKKTYLDDFKDLIPPNLRKGEALIIADGGDKFIEQKEDDLSLEIDGNIFTFDTMEDKRIVMEMIKRVAKK